MRDVFNTYWAYAVGWFNLPAVRFSLWLGVYIAYALTWALFTSAFTASAMWVWLVLWFIYATALVKMADPLMNAWRKWRTGKSHREELREAYVSLGRAEQALEDSLRVQRIVGSSLHDR